MNTANKISTLLGKRPPDMTIAWEFQPSLQHLVKRTESVHRDGPIWAETMPATLEDLREPVTFREPLEGLSMRDIDEPEIFRVYFGDTEAATTRA